MSARLDLAYQRISSENASPRALTILLYDRLVVDIQFAIAAMQRGDIEQRCNRMNHAFLILGHLQSGLNMEEGGETAKSLEGFYRYIHATLLEAQVKQSTSTLQQLIERILQVRSAWYEVESRESAAAAQPSVAIPEESQRSGAMRRSVYNTDEYPVSSWSA